MQVLLAVSEVAQGRVGEHVDLELVHQRLTKVFPITREGLEDQLDFLVDRQLLHGAKTFGGITVFLNARGRSVADSFAEARNDVVERLRKAQDDYLRWIFLEAEMRDGVPTPDGFLKTQPTYYGSPYTEREIERAGERLEAGSFIYGPGVDQYRAPLRPMLTEKGREVVNRGISVHDARASTVASNTTYSTTVHGNANVNNGGSDVTQTVQSESWAPQVSAVLDALTQAISALPEATANGIRPLIEDARGGVSVEDRPLTRRALIAVGEFLQDSSAGALGAILSAPVLALIPLLGG